MYFYFTLRHFYAASLPGGPYLFTHKGKLWDFSPELKELGLSLQTPLKTARHHAPEAQIITVDFADYEAARDPWLQWSFQWFSHIQPHYPHAWYARLDLPLSWEPIAEDFQRFLRQQGMEGTWGGGWSQCTARLAARCGTGLVVTADTTESFLAPLPVHWLFPELAPALEALGIVNIGRLANVPLPQLYQQFGSDAEQLFKKSRGLDQEPFRSMQRPVTNWQFSFAGHPAFAGASPSAQQLQAVLLDGCSQLAATAQHSYQLVKEFRVMWSFAGTETCSRSFTLHAASQDAQVLWRRLQPHVPSKPPTAVELRVETWEEQVPEQLDLFASPPKAKTSVAQLAAQLQEKLGRHAVTLPVVPRREQQLNMWESQGL